jgi:hypothetical protein
MGGGEEFVGVEEVKQILQGAAFAAWLLPTIAFLLALLLNFPSVAANWLPASAIYIATMLGLFVMFVLCGSWLNRRGRDLNREKRWRDHERDQLSKQWRARGKRQ